MSGVVAPGVEALASSVATMVLRLGPLYVGQVVQLHRFEGRWRRVLSTVLPQARMKVVGGRIGQHRVCELSSEMSFVVQSVAVKLTSQ